MEHIIVIVNNFLNRIRDKIYVFKSLHLLLDSTAAHLNELSCKLSKCRDNIILDKKLHTHILDSLFKNSQYILWVKDLEGRYVYISDRIVKDNKIENIIPDVLGLRDDDIIKILIDNEIDPSDTFWDKKIETIETINGNIEFFQMGTDAQYCGEIETVPLVIDGKILGYCAFSKII